MGLRERFKRSSSGDGTFLKSQDTAELERNGSDYKTDRS